MVAKKKTKRSTTQKKGKKAPALHITDAKQFGPLKDLMGKSPVILVLVYADWCGHCQHFKPDWKSLEQLPNRNMAMVSIRDDVFSSSPLNNMITPEGYPTVAVVKPASNTAVNLPSREKTKLTNVVTNAPLISETPNNLSNNVKNVMNNSGIKTQNYVNTEQMYPETNTTQMNSARSKSTPKPISNDPPVKTGTKPSLPKSELDYLKESESFNYNKGTPSEYWREEEGENLDTPSATDFHKYPVKKGSQGGGGLWDSITNYRNHATSMLSMRKNRKTRRAAKN
jgi:thiol-disulfide isomerase/thioredoxin